MNTHFINSRAYTTLFPINQELHLDSQKNYLFDLSYLGVLSLQGDKTVEFLQGQLTADGAKVTDIQMIQSAQCNLKGRILALMDLINWNGFKIIVPKDILEQTQTSLGKTALLSRVHIKKESQLTLYGFYLQDPNDLIPQSLFLPKDLYAKAESPALCYYHLGHGFYIFIVHNDGTHFEEAFKEKNQLLGSLTWHTLRLQQRELSIYPESRGLFLPHRLDLHNTSYLSFDKGCYKGQEIIARTHYRATLKHELRLYTIHTQAQLFSGQKLFKTDEPIELGELVDYSYLDKDYYLLAVSMLKTAPLTVRLENNENPIQLNSVN